MGCGGPLSLTGAGCRPDVLGRRGDTSGVSCASARAPAPGPLPPRGGVTCKNWTSTWGAGPCGGPRAPGPPVTFLSTRSFKLVVPQHGSHGKSGGLGRFCGTPKRRCPAISSHLSWGPCRGLQVQGGVLGTTSAQVMEGSIWQYPEYDRKPGLGLRKGSGVCLQP